MSCPPCPFRPAPRMQNGRRRLPRGKAARARGIGEQCAAIRLESGRLGCSGATLYNLRQAGCRKGVRF